MCDNNSPITCLSSLLDTIDICSIWLEFKNKLLSLVDTGVLRFTYIQLDYFTNKIIEKLNKACRYESEAMTESSMDIYLEWATQIIPDLIPKVEEDDGEGWISLWIDIAHENGVVVWTPFKQLLANQKPLLFLPISNLPLKLYRTFDKDPQMYRIRKESDN